MGNLHRSLFIASVLVSFLRVALVLLVLVVSAVPWVKLDRLDWLVMTVLPENPVPMDLKVQLVTQVQMDLPVLTDHPMNQVAMHDTVCTECVEQMVHKESKDSKDHQVHQEKLAITDHKVFKVIKVSKEKLACPDHQESKEHQKW